MEQPAKSPKRVIFLCFTLLLLVVGGFSIRATYTRYNPPGLPEHIPEADGAGGIPDNPREHIMKVMEGLDLTTRQWVELARLGRPTGTPEEREEHARKIAKVLNEEQFARFSAEMREIHYAILNHMMTKMTQEDQEAFLKRLERHPDYSPGPPRALLTGASPQE